MRALVFIGLLLSSACSNERSGDNPDALDPGVQKGSPRTQMVSACGANPLQPLVLELDLALVGNEGRRDICIDRSDAVNFETGYARVHLRADSGATLQVHCNAPTAHRQFYERHTGGDVVLVASGVALGIYQVSQPIEGIPCGQLEFNALEPALDYCEALAKAWQLDSSACLNFCVGDEGICVSRSPPPRELSPE